MAERLVTREQAAAHVREHYPSPLDELNDVVRQLDRLRKTVICPTEMVAQIRAFIDQNSPIAGLYDVQSSAFTDGHIYIIDQSALRWWLDG
jgi:hypothetical protein